MPANISGGSVGPAGLAYSPVTDTLYAMGKCTDFALARPPPPCTFLAPLLSEYQSLFVLKRVCQVIAQAYLP